MAPPINILLPKPFDYSGLKVAAMAGGSLQSRDRSRPPEGRSADQRHICQRHVGDTGGRYLYPRGHEDEPRVHPRLGRRAISPVSDGPDQPRPASRRAIRPALPGLIPTTASRCSTWFPQQNGADQQTTSDERIDGRLALQWRPSDSLLLTLDDNFSKQTLKSNDYGYAAWFNGDDLRNVKYDSNGSVVDFNQFGTPMDFNANRRRVEFTNGISSART